MKSVRLRRYERVYPKLTANDDCAEDICSTGPPIPPVLGAVPNGDSRYEPVQVPAVICFNVYIIWLREHKHMNLEQRRAGYAKIEAYRKRPLIVYATSTRQGLVSMMAADAVREFVDQINAITDGDSVDVLIHSTGGDPLTAWKLMSLLRERFTDVAVLVPFMAFSAATIFALGANEIVMHPHASLGPIDPQIQLQQSDGTVRHFAYEDVSAFLRFLEKDIKISEQAHVSTIIDRLFTVVDPVSVGGAKRASDLSADMGERLLLMHMSVAGEGAKRPRDIAEDLNKSFFAHGDAVSRNRAKVLSLKIAKEDKELEALIWDAYLGIEGSMQLRQPWNPLEHFLADATAAATLVPMGPAQLPPNAPPQVIQQVWQAVMQQAMGSIQTAAVQVPFSIQTAVCESVRLASESRVERKVSATMQLAGDIKLNLIQTSNGWKAIGTGQS
jgi:hypothetical protein